MVDDQISTAEELLRIREARGLRVPVVVRILFGLYGVISIFTAPIPPGSRLIILSISIPLIAANVYFLALLRQVKRVGLVGITGVVLDAVFVLVYPFLMYHILDQPSLPLAVVSKVPAMLGICFIFIVIESLALRPVYTTIITGATLIAHLSLIVLSIQRPDVNWSSDPTAALNGPGVSLWWIPNAMIFLLTAGGALTWLTRGVRRTVIQAAELEAERFYLMREQADLLMESRIGALGELVAGVSHEMNNPLGAIKANAETWYRAVSRIRDSLRSSAESGRVDDRIEGILDALERSSHSTLEASERMGSTLKTLRSFARLDEAEFKQVDIHEALDNTLALIPAKTIGNAQVVKRYGDIAEIQAYAGRLNQVFMTLLTHAFHAMDGEGTVTITTGSEGEEVSIRIADTSPGIPTDQLDRIFDIRLEAGESRVEAGFGMAACHSIVSQHRGQIRVESSLGKGTTFTLVLPVRESGVG